MNLLRRFIGQAKKNDTTVTAPSALQYVDWLTTYMLRTSTVELTIDSARPLPGASETNPMIVPPCIPAPEAVFNRLKLVCGLQPVLFQKQEVGSFQKEVRGHRLLITVNFSDTPSRSVAKIQLRIRHGSIG